MNDWTERTDRLARRFGPALIALAAAAMLAWTWRTWPDPLVDFGQQLYVSWRIVEGQVLYRDLAYHYGPLAPYLNALLFRLFGTSLTTLVVANLIVLVGAIVLLHRLLCGISGRMAATLGCLTFVFVFAFGQLVEIGNYNWITPYVNGVTHGIALSLLAIYLLWVFHRTQRVLALVGCGLALGLTLLTKTEVSLACAVAVLDGLAAVVWSLRPGGRRTLALLSAFTACVLAPPVLAFTLLCAGMPARDALSGTLGTWPDIVAGKLARLPFYQWSLGVDDVATSLKQALMVGGAATAVVGLSVALALLMRRPDRRHVGVVAAVFLVVSSVLVSSGLYWPSSVRPLPIVMLGLALWSVVGLFRRHRGGLDLDREVLRLTLLVFAFVLLAKILLNVRTFHYGFALAMPATVLTVVALFDWLPARIDRAGGYGAIVRAAVVGAWSIFIVGHLGITAYWFDEKTEIVASGPDAFHADWRGEYVNSVLDEIEAFVGEDESLAVMPAGVMINYLARRPNPTPFLYFMPSDVILYGEDPILEALEAAPPDFVLIVHKDTSEFGYRFLGRQYGIFIGLWIRENYEEVSLIGEPPLVEGNFGMRLMRRTTADVP
jgi:hypothetical protein